MVDSANLMWRKQNHNKLSESIVGSLSLVWMTETCAEEILMSALCGPVMQGHIRVKTIFANKLLTCTAATEICQFTC